jgi:hypothetical protein
MPESSEIMVDERPIKFDTQTEHPGTQKTDLFVFVGEKIELVEVKPPNGEIWMDSAFDAKYRVIETVHGEFEGSIIEFRVFDHYGYPPFANTSHALLFVSEYEGKLYHEKYQYHTVYQTTDGRWAACGDPYLRGMEYHRKPFTPKPLEFAEPVTFDLENYSADKKRKFFGEPFFEIVNGKAVCKMGAYVDELYQINRDGVLKARGVGQ